MAWIKCADCFSVVDDAGHDCKPAKPNRSRKSSAESVRKHREKTGNAYGKAYARAKAAAVSELVTNHYAEYVELLEKARIDNGLGPTRS